MTTGEKLSLLMELSGVNTHRLARAIHVDPSSVSRWANDKRSLKSDSEFVDKIADYFLHRQPYDAQRRKISDLLFPGVPAESVDGAALELRFREWLLFDGRPAAPTRRSRAVAGEEMAGDHIRALLGNLGEITADPPEGLFDEIFVPAQPGRAAEVEIYYGDDGIREALLSVAASLVSRDQPGELLITSQDDLSWYIKPDFLRRWMQAVGAVLQKGRIRVIFRLNRGMGSILTLIRSWLPMILTGRVEALYYTRYQEPAVAMTLAVVPGSAAMFSLKSQSDEAHGCTYVHRDTASVEFYRGKFLDLATVSQPLIRVYNQASLPALQRDATLIEERRGGAMLCSRGLNPLLLPAETYEALLERAGLGAAERDERVALHRRRQEAFRAELSTGQCSDICPMETLESMVSDRGFRYQGIDLYSPGDVEARPEEVVSHLQGAMDALNAGQGYRLALTPLEGVFEDHIWCWSLKADGAAVVCARNRRDTFVVECREGTVLQGFEDYFNDLWESIPPVDRDRELVKRKISDHIERLKGLAANGTKKN